MTTTRRKFIQQLSTVAAGLSVFPQAFSAETFKGQFTISLAQWSLHRTLNAKKMTNLDFPEVARKQYGISAVEYVNQFFKDKAKDKGYLADLLKRCKDNGIKNHLIMIDGEGNLGATSDSERQKAVENHFQWVDAAKYLGCATIRVNAYGQGDPRAVQDAAVDGIGKLGEYGRKVGINIIIENHGGSSSNGDWLLELIKRVNMKNVGILPDFGNFCIKRATGDLYSGQCLEEYDRYKAVQMWMPYAKGVSAKTMDFDSAGNCVETDYNRIMKIVQDAGFNGYVGIEYEGSKLSEVEGIRATKSLLQKVGKQLGYKVK
jgi:sugar phosphate isomerase/epimerase